MRSHYHHTTMFIALAPLLYAACADTYHDEAQFLEAPLSGDLLDTNQSSLWSSRFTSLHPQPTVQICFSPVRFSVSSSQWTAVAGNDPDYVAFRNDLQPLLEHEYESNPDSGLDLQGWGVCADRATGASVGSIRIVVNLGDNGTGVYKTCQVTADHLPHADANLCANGIGYESGRESTVFVAVNPNLAGFGDFQRTVVLHELGHALNFKHEFDRADSNQTPETCTPRTAVPSNQGYTRYDPDSIMNGTYCHTRPSLSRLDKLGLAIAYPRTFTQMPQFTGGIWLGDGSVVAMPGASVAQAWIEAGAGTGAFQVRPTWSIDGGGAIRVDTLAIPSGTHAVRGTFSDFLNRQHTIAAVRTTQSAPVFASILLTIL